MRVSSNAKIKTIVIHFLKMMLFESKVWKNYLRFRDFVDDYCNGAEFQQSFDSFHLSGNKGMHMFVIGTKRPRNRNLM